MSKIFESNVSTLEAGGEGGGCDEEQLCKCFPPRPRLERVWVNSVREQQQQKRKQVVLRFLIPRIRQIIPF